MFVYADAEIKGIIYNVIKDAILYHCNIAFHTTTVFLIYKSHASCPEASTVRKACFI